MNLHTLPHPALYRVGAYVVYPLLAATGGQLLVSANSPEAVAEAAALLAGALAFPGCLARLCKQCAEKPVPRFLRLAVMPATVATALAVRSSTGLAQFLALLLLGLSAVTFEMAWRASGEKSDAGKPADRAKI